MRSLFGLATLLACLASPAARARDTLVVLKSDDLPEYDEPTDAFIGMLGRPAEVLNLRGNKQRAMQLVAPLKEDRPPVVVAIGAKAAWIAATELPGVPLVYAMVMDPHRYGVYGAFVTGVAMDVSPDMALAQFQLFAPEVRNIGIIVSQSNTGDVVGDAISAARAAGYEVTARRVGSSDDVRRAFAHMRGTIDAIWLLPDPVVLTPTNFRAIHAEAMRSKMPVFSYSEALVHAGGLMCVAPDRREVGRQAAELVRRVLDGETAGTIEPVAPSATRIVLNRDTQQAIGLELDAVLLDFVDEVVSAPSSR